MSNTTELIKLGDLYALLSICSDEDLDPLVKVMLTKLSNALDINEDYKKYNPHHHHYHKLIGDELRAFGGNSFSNLFRGSGPPYDEIVMDVCKKLDVPCEAGKTVENESNLLNIHLERQWKSLTPEQQREFIEKARAEAAGSLSDAGTLIKEAGSFLVMRALLGPLAWGSLAIGIADPAFKVTIPCVLHVAYLRRRYLENLAKEAASLPRVKVLPAAAQPKSAITLERSESLTIGSQGETPVLTLAQVSDPGKVTWFPTDGEHGISRLNPLLQAVPALATAAEVGTGKYMEVIVKGTLAPAKDGAGVFLPHVRENGVIKEVARLKEAGTLSNIVNAAALWQIASVAVAQKHLADISAKLSDIKAGVDRVLNFQKNERKALLTGATRYFEQIAPAVLDGELSEGIRHQIERHEADLLKVQDHLLEDIRRESQGILEVKDGGSLGSKGMQDAIRAHQELLDDLYRQLLLCIRARACGWQLLLVFPGEKRLKEARKQSIQEALEVLSKGSELLDQTDRFMRKKVKEMSSAWNLTVTVNERKLSLLQWTEVMADQVLACKAQIERDIQAAEAFATDIRGPVRMLVKVEGGEIVATATI